MTRAIFAMRAGIAATLAVLFVLALPIGEAVAQTVELATGAQRFLNFKEPVKRVAVGNGEIVDATVLDDRQVRILGLRPGRTDIAVFTGDDEKRTMYLVNVTPDIDGLRRLLRNEPGLEGVRLNVDGGRVVMSGTVGSVDAHRRAQALASAYLGDAGANQTQGPGGAGGAAGALAALGAGGGRGGGGIVDTTRVVGDQMVAVEVKFAAVSVSTLKALGFNFGAFGRGFTVAGTSPSTVNSFEFSRSGLSLDTALPLNDAFNVFVGSPKHNVLAVLGALSGTDLAQILAEPTLLVRSGEQANFIAGGEIPVPVPQSGSSNTITIEYKPFGVRLNIAPTVLSGNRIVLRVAPEVSELDFSNALTLQGFNIPAFRKRATSTTVELVDGQSFVLAGLMYSTTGNVEDKIPGLGDIPILGNFFKRTRDSREQQELIIIATPRLVQPIDANKLPPLPGQEFVQQYKRDVGDMLLNRMPLDEAVAKHGLIK